MVLRNKIKYYLSSLLVVFAINSNAQQVSFVLTTDTIVVATQKLISASAKGYIQNNSSDSVTVRVYRTLNDIVGPWRTSLCLDICYLTNIDSADVTIASGEQQLFTHYFQYWEHTTDTARTRIEMRNLSNNEVFYGQHFYGVDSMYYEEVDGLHNEVTFPVIPSFVTGNLDIPVHFPTVASVFNIQGICFYKLTEPTSEVVKLNFSRYPEGIYFIRLAHGKHAKTYKVIKKP